MRIWNYYRNKKLFYRGGLLWFLIFFWSAHIFAQSQESSLAEREFTFAQKLYDDGLFTLAAQEFQHFVEKYPTHPKAPEALFLSGSAYFAAKQFLKAFDTYRDLEIRFPNSELLPRARYQLARCQLNLKHYLDAAALFKRVATLHPEDGLAPLALFEAGKAFYLKGEKDRAISTFLELIHTYPDVPQRLEAHFEIVKIYFEQKSYSHALREINAIMNILNEGIEDPRVYWYRGLVFERLGQWREAESNFQQLVEKFPHDKLAAAAYFKLGNLAYMQGFLEKSLEMFQKSLTNNEDYVLIFKAFIQLGTIQAEKGNFDEALAYLLKADSLAKNSEPDFKARHRFARMLAKLKQYNKAAIQFRKIIKKMRQATKPDTSLIAQVYSEYLKVLIDQGSLDEALNLIKQFTISFPDVKAEKLQLEKARLLEKHLQKHTRALRAYDEFLEKYRSSPYVDEAQFGLARCYEKLSQFKLALNEYKEYLQNYPGGDDYLEVQQRKTWIEHTVVLDENANLSKMAQFFTHWQTDNRDRQIRELELGKLYLELKDFHNALKQFKLALTQNIDSKTKALLFYLVGKAYYRLGEKSNLFDQPQQALAYFDSARVALSYFADHPDAISNTTEEALYLLAKLNLSQNRQTDSQISLLQELYGKWVQYITNPRYLDFILIHLADGLLDAGQDSVTIQEALAHYRQILHEFPGSAFRDKAQIGEARALYKLGADSLAVLNLKNFVQKNPRSSYRLQGLFLLAGWYKNRGDWQTALKYLQQIKKEYYYSSRTVEAFKQIAEIYFQQGNYELTLDALKSYRELSAQLENETQDWSLFLEAQSQESLGKLEQALHDYLYLLRRFPESELSLQAMLGVARIAKKLKQNDLAVQYYQSLLKHYPETSYKLTVLVNLADIFFIEEKFQEARNYYLKALQSTASASSDSLQRYSAKQAVRCLYKLKQFRLADQEAKKFLKKYKDTRDEKGQFLLDKARAYLEEKNFILAEKFFKKLKDDFKRTEFGAQGEFGLGQVYLITNHTEDALKILTAITDKYPDSEITPLTYLNLGDFYYNSQQVENAILAFKKVLEHPKAGENYGKALRYLIASYDKVQFWDKAIALTREYLQKFPDAEDALDMRIKLGLFLMRLKEYRRAIEHFRQLLPYASDENEAEIQFYIAQCYKEMGNFEKAASEYLKVKYLTRPTKLPWHVTALYEAGDCFARLGEIDQARQIFQKIIRQEGKDSNFGRFASKRLAELAQKSPTDSN